MVRSYCVLHSKVGLIMEETWHGEDIQKCLAVTRKCLKQFQTRLRVKLFNFDEYKSVANLGLGKAYATYDPSYEVNFCSWIWIKVHGELKEYYRKTSTEFTKVRLYYTRDTLPPSAAYVRYELQHDLDYALSKLGVRTYQAICSYALDEDSKEFCKRTGQQLNTYHSLCHQAKARMKKALLDYKEVDND